ncbi:MAG: sensor histidine kinase [Sandaracinaceae bacterium]
MSDGPSEVRRRSGPLSLLRATGGLAILLAGAAVAAWSPPRPDLAATVFLFLVAASLLLVALRPRPARHLTVALDLLYRRLRRSAAENAERRRETSPPVRFQEEFLAAVRHELKNPLNAILGFTEVLLGEIDGPLTARQHEDVMAVRSAGLYLQELVDAVLEEWDPEIRESQTVVPLDLKALLEEVAQLLRGQLAGRSLALRVEAKPPLPRILGDRRRLRQALLNLGTNALRATERGEVVLRASPHPDGARLTVQDTGEGIPEELVPRLFEEFTPASAQKSGHTGLGLALTKNLVEWHGGRIEVETEVGRGTSFHMILPNEAR